MSGVGEGYASAGAVLGRDSPKRSCGDRSGFGWNGDFSFEPNLTNNMLRFSIMAVAALLLVHPVSAEIPEGHVDFAGSPLENFSDFGGADVTVYGVSKLDETSGCTDEAACNYDPLATDDDGSCLFPEAGYDCDGNCLNDVNGDGVCDLELAGCTDEMACNFNPNAIEPDGSCLYPDALGDCGGDCSADANGNGICDALDALLCGPGTVFDAATGQCVGTGSTCPGDFDDNGLIGVNDLLIFLGLFDTPCD